MLRCKRAAGMVQGEKFYVDEEEGIDATGVLNGAKKCRDKKESCVQ